MGSLRRMASVMRATALTAGVLLVSASEPDSPTLRAGEVPPPPVRTDSHATLLVFSAQARRFLNLEARSFSTEFIGCMIGEAHGPVVVVSRIAPADVDPIESATTHVVPRESCENSGWEGTVGIIHSHPTAERCWYFFPGTQVMTSDAQSFLYQPYPVDAILCGRKVVWVGRDMLERNVVVAPSEHNASTPAAPQRGNMVQGGAGPDRRPGEY